MSCDRPIDAAVLADHWIAILDEREEQAVEEHLLECDGCGERLRGVIAMAEGIRSLARSGSLRMVVSDEYLKCAAGEGMRVREYAPPAGESVACTVTVEDDLLIARLAADLTGVERVDLTICDSGGVEQLRLADIPIPAGATSVAYQESMSFAKAAPSNTLVVRLVTPGVEGGERVLGEYTFNHTRSMPGPAAW